MIIRMLSAGKSFKGLGADLTHDADAATDERVAWTHTLNLANDHVPSAIDEMLWTARNAELLKQEAGIRAGGRTTENAVKHLSLNWSPEESPTRDHKISATEDFLRAMNWHERQAILVAHQDREHSHVHIMLNRVHPESGLSLDEGFEFRRAQKWALAYELEQGNVLCEQRLENAENREESPTRPMWTAFEKSKKEFERDEKARAENTVDPDDPENMKKAHAAEWRWIKEFQRDERKDFFAEGKTAFSDMRRSVYREVREEFRPLWADYFEALKEGGDSDDLRNYKADLVAEQKSAIDTRRDAAFQELRESRNADYRGLLGDQREIRSELRWRQENGLDTDLFFQMVKDGSFGKSAEMGASFRDAAEETTQRAEKSTDRTEGVDAGEALRGAPDEGQRTYGGRHSDADRAGMRSGFDIGAGLGVGLAFGFAGMAGSIADGLTGTRRAPRAAAVEQEPRDRNLFDYAAESAKASERKRQDDDEAAYQQRQRDRYWE